MKKQRGSGLVVGLVALTIVVAVAAVGFLSYVSAYNYGNRMEQQLIATQDNNRNIYAQYGQRVLEVAQVPSMYRDDVVEVVTAALEGRYGDNGSQATWQWLQEQNPSLDPSLYTNIQQVIEAGRGNFESGQRRLIDVRRQYETALGSFWQGMWLRFAGYPMVNIDDFAIVSTDQANQVFENYLEEGPIQLR